MRGVIEFIVVALKWRAVLFALDLNSRYLSVYAKICSENRIQWRPFPWVAEAGKSANGAGCHRAGFAEAGRKK